MIRWLNDRRRWRLAMIAGGIAVAPVPQVTAQYMPALGEPTVYHPIKPDKAAETIVLTGHDLTIDQVVAVARGGAKVAYSPEARQHMADAYGLLLEGSAQGVSIYWFNRGAGGARETVMFAGDPETPENRKYLLDTQMRAFRGGASGGYPPEVPDEDIVRAMMVIRANAMMHNGPSPALAQMLIDMINARIAPVVNARGTVGEGDLAPLSRIGAAMVGAGDVYYQGVRMSAADALAKAGLKPLVPFAADNNALTSSNAFAAAQAALLVHDAQRMLEWADTAYAMDLNGMNSSVTPLTLAVQDDRPDPWLNWHAGKIKAMIRGSYLFDADSHRIIQDPESLRASSIRQASAWRAWAQLRDSVVFQINTSDHNPVVKVGMKPSDSWELATPQMMRFFVKGGPRSRGQSGYILSNANWDPYPLMNDVENFSIALANMDVAVLNRMQRFSSTFFTVVKASDILSKGGRGGSGGYTPVDLWQEIQSLAVPIAAEGNSLGDGVEELQAQSRLKTARARQLVSASLSLIAFDINNGARWIDVRKAQDPSRTFGVGVDGAWRAYRNLIPLEDDAPGGLPQNPDSLKIYAFLSDTPATSFFAGPAMPPAAPLPVVRW